MAGYSFPKAVLLLVALPLLAPIVLGAGVVVGPDSIVDGDAIFISLTNLTNGTRLDTNLTATFPPVAGVTWLNLTDWNYPFTLQGGRLGVSGQNVNRLLFSVRAGSVLLTGVSTGAGNITVEIPADIQPFTFYDFRIGYEVHNVSAPLAFTLYQQGIKAGPATEANLTPSVIGVREGSLTVAVRANGTLAGKKEIQVSMTAPLPTPTSVIATATPSETPSAAPATPAVSAPPTSAQTTPVTTPPTPAQTTPVTTPPIRPGTSPPPATTATTPPAAAGTPAESAGPSPFILVYVAVIVLVAVVADYVIMKD